MKTLLAIILLTACVYSQDIRVGTDETGYTFTLVNYTLPEGIITYLIYYDGECIYGGGMDHSDFYTPTYFAKKPGEYLIILKMNERVILQKKFAVK